MHIVQVMYIFQHSDMLVHTQLNVTILHIYIYLSISIYRLGTYRYQVLCMFLLHKMVHIQLECAHENTY